MSDSPRILDELGAELDRAVRADAGASMPGQRYDGSRHRFFWRIPLMGVIATLCVGGVAFAGTRLLANSNPLDGLDALTHGAPVVLSAEQRQLLTASGTASYGLELSRARAAKSAWIVIPGSDGVCLIPGDRSLTCGPLDAFEEGRLAMTADATAIGQRYVEGEPPAIGPGAGRVLGIVPNDVEHVAGFDAAGNEIARTAVVNNVYELDVASFRDLAEVRLVHADDSTTPLPLGF